MASAKARHRVGLGLLGSGVVGEAIQDIVFNDLKGQVGTDLQLEIRKIYTRRPKEKKWFSSHSSLFTTKVEDVIDDQGVDIVVEVLGFQREAELPTFRDYILQAFEKGKSVVTSDKAVLARFGKELWAAAKKHSRQLRFEACVEMSIPSSFMPSIAAGFTRPGVVPALHTSVPVGATARANPSAI